MYSNLNIPAICKTVHNKKPTFKNNYVEITKYYDTLKDGNNLAEHFYEVEFFSEIKDIRIFQIKLSMQTYSLYSLLITMVKQMKIYITSFLN